MQAMPKNFPDILNADGSESHRIGFVGEDAPKDIWSLYVGERGKRVTNPKLRHVRYRKC